MTVIERRSGGWTAGLAPEERNAVYRLVRDTLEWCVKRDGDVFDMSRYALTGALRTERATFVTLHKRGMLRGCIGSLSQDAPLYQSVHENAVNAALHDPRFPPVQALELPALSLEISILSPIIPIDGIEQFRIGEHGIIMEKNKRRAVYLPDVALEQGWTVAETLCALSEKAGLAPDAWQTGAVFSVFSSTVLSEG